MSDDTERDSRVDISSNSRADISSNSLLKVNPIKPTFIDTNKKIKQSSSIIRNINNEKNDTKKKDYQMHNIAKQIYDELTEEADIDITGVDIGSLTRMIKEFNVYRFDNDEYKSTKEIILEIISDKNINGGFSIIDIGAIIRQYRLWRRYLPNVELFYAVKCNPHHIILRTLANLGVGFDVASIEEISMAVDAGVDRERDRIIFANPCKREAFISYARSQHVQRMTFDSEDELLKIARLHPTSQLVLRITVDDITTSKQKFGVKFGCPIYDVEKILHFAKFHKLNVIGVSFHVGSNCTDAVSYSNSIKRARVVFEIAKRIGYNFTMLDIGGGFPGSDDENNTVFAEMSSNIQMALKKYFSNIENLRIIAEPGRFFATSTLTHVIRITGKKSILLTDKTDKEYNSLESTEPEDNNVDSHINALADFYTSKTETKSTEDRKVFHYNVDSNVYGMFNNIIFDDAKIDLDLLNEYDETTFKSVVFGETCDSRDTIVYGIDMPELVCGDYIYVKDHGAYTLASASNFNSLPISDPIIIFTF